MAEENADIGLRIGLNDGGLAGHVKVALITLSVVERKVCVLKVDEILK